MKISLTVSAIVMLFLGPPSVSAQTDVLAHRARACNINAGYSMADVVETARNFEWSEETAPGVIIFREAVAVAGDFEYDFVFDAYYPSYADMTEKRVAFRNRPGGRNGRGFSDVATCTDNTWISSVRFATPPTGSPIPEVSVALSTLCELNGATVADAVTLAGTIGQNLGASTAVAIRNFGGPRVPNGSSAEIRIFFPSSGDFGAALDRVQQNTSAPNQQNRIVCSTGSLWVSRLIHSRNN